MPETRKTALSLLKTHRADLVAFISLLVFLITAAALVRSFLVLDHISWASDSHSVNEGPMRARRVLFQAAPSRGAIGFCLERYDWSIDSGSHSSWRVNTHHPARSVIEGLPPMGRADLQLAGFQWSHTIVKTQWGTLLGQETRWLVLPLWPLLIASAIPPWLWWRRRRRRMGGRGFPITPPPSPSDSVG
jgi:hypothetical protein